MAKETNSKEEPIEKQLWKSVDKLRKNIDAAEYKHIVLGLIFLKYIFVLISKAISDELPNGFFPCSQAFVWEHTDRRNFVSDQK